MLSALPVRLGFEGLFYVEPLGLSGGLAMLWRCSALITLQSYSKIHVNMIVMPLGLQEWRLMGYY